MTDPDNTPIAAPGTSAYYDKHIFPRLHETLSIGSGDPPSRAIDWMLELGVVDGSRPLSILEVGCGAGRNLVAMRKIFPNATLHGFEGSQLALEMARSALGDAVLVHGDLHGIWPFPGPHDLVLDITCGIPESPTEADVHDYAGKLHAAVLPGGYALIEAVSKGDQSSRRFGSGNVVTWEREGDAKPERIIDMSEAQELYVSHGFEIVASRIEQFEEEAFSSEGVNIGREFVQLVIRRPLRPRLRALCATAISNLIRASLSRPWWGLPMFRSARSRGRWEPASYRLKWSPPTQSSVVSRPPCGCSISPATPVRLPRNWWGATQPSWPTLHESASNKALTLLTSTWDVRCEK
jgi:SAM-dependent methyltransferase